MVEPSKAQVQEPGRLREAMRQARIDIAERTAVIVDLHDAEVARLELLNESLTPLFAEIPADVEIFDRGISRGDPPRLWIDMIAHVVMGRDKRLYRFLQDTRNGPKVLAEATAVEPIVEAVTKYVARRIIERERALASDRMEIADTVRGRRRGAWRDSGIFILGLAFGIAAMFVIAWFAAARL